MRDVRWYGRQFELDPNAVQLRMHVDVPRQMRPVHARLFQVPSADQRHDSPLWQYVEGWAVDPETCGPMRSVDDALAHLCNATLQMRLPGIG